MPSDAVVEQVPRLRRRYGDYVVEGSNNTIAIFGTDRAKKGPATVGDGLGHVNAPDQGKGTGTIHFIAGRKASDPDLEKDDSFIYLTMKSKVDDNLDLGGVEAATNDKPAAIVKSDLIRVVGRTNIKICANDDDKHYLFMDGNKIKINFNTNATVVIVDKKITIKMGNNIIEMDDSKAHIDVGSTKFTMDGSEVKIDSPKVHLTGGCEAPWDDMFKSLIDFDESHNHLGASGPTGPGKTGPTSITFDATLKLKKSAWDTKVKS